MPIEFVNKLIKYNERLKSIKIKNYNTMYILKTILIELCIILQ